MSCDLFTTFTFVKFPCDKEYFLSTRSVINLLLSDIMFRYFALLVFVLHFADILTTKNYIHPVCDSDYEILK